MTTKILHLEIKTYCNACPELEYIDPPKCGRPYFVCTKNGKILKSDEQDNVIIPSGCPLPDKREISEPKVMEDALVF
jgi:hypothetical protein